VPAAETGSGERVASAGPTLMPACPAPARLPPRASAASAASRAPGEMRGEGLRFPWRRKEAAAQGGGGA